MPSLSEYERQQKSITTNPKQPRLHPPFLHKEDIMQTLQIKALELEASALKYVDGFVHEHALWFLIGIIYLLLALLAWVLGGGYGIGMENPYLVSGQ